MSSPYPPPFETPTPNPYPPPWEIFLTEHVPTATAIEIAVPTVQTTSTRNTNKTLPEIKPTLSYIEIEKFSAKSIEGVSLILLLCMIIIFGLKTILKK